MERDGVPRRVPRPPSYAWDWLQRSRPVLQALSQRLTGQAPVPGFIDELRAAFDDDPFVHAVVVDTIADVAFAGRVPRTRPVGVAWDRGLIWWAATLAGTTRRDFEQGVEQGGQQRKLFEPPAAAVSTPAAASSARAPADTTPVRPVDDPAPRPSVVVTLERRRLANALRALVERSGGADVPVDAIRQLIHDLESPR